MRVSNTGIRPGNETRWQRQPVPGSSRSASSDPQAAIQGAVAGCLGTVWIKGAADKDRYCRSAWALLENGFRCIYSGARLWRHSVRNSSAVFLREACAMWCTPDGERILQGAEGRLFRDALGMVVELVRDDAEGLRQFNAPPFDKLQPNQKLAVLAQIGTALLCKDQPMPRLTAVWRPR